MWYVAIASGWLLCSFWFLGLDIRWLNEKVPFYRQSLFEWIMSFVFAGLGPVSLPGMMAATQTIVPWPFRGRRPILTPLRFVNTDILLLATILAELRIEGEIDDNFISYLPAPVKIAFVSGSRDPSTLGYIAYAYHEMYLTQLVKAQERLRCNNHK